MTKTSYRSTMDFQRAAEETLKPMSNLYFLCNTWTFICWWMIFAGVVLLTHWVPSPYNWITILLAVGFTVLQTHLYIPSTSDYLYNISHVRRLSDQSQQYFSRDGIIPHRMTWVEILFGIGRPCRRPPRHVRDYEADWCMNHRELLMQYVLSLPHEVEELRRERRTERREQQRQQVSPVIRKVEIVPVASVMLTGVRSVMPRREQRAELVRPVTPTPRPEPRTPTRPIISSAQSESSGEIRVFRRLEEVIELLNVLDLLPDRIDHEHVRAIIVWGCLNPGKRGKTMVLKQYITEQNVREKVRNKLGRNYSPDAFEAALAWLRRVRVIISDHKHKRHQPVVALNPHTKNGVGVGTEVIRRVLATQDAIVELTSGN